MVKVSKLVYDFYRKANSANSGNLKDYRVVDVISYLNEAYEIIFENLVNNDHLNENIRNHLRQLEVHGEELKVKRVNTKVSRVDYPDNLYKRLNHRAIICTKDCPDKEVVIKILQSDDLNEARNNPYRKGDYCFEQYPAKESGNSLYLYHEGEFITKKVFIDYYKKITPVQAPKLVANCNIGYKNWNNDLIVEDVDFEIDSTYINRVVSDVAVLLSARDSQNYDSFNAQFQQILQIANI